MMRAKKKCLGVGQRKLWFTAAGLIFASGCGADTLALNTPRWHGKAVKQPLGATFEVPHDDEDALHTMQALGFKKIADGQYLRQADLLTVQQLTPSIMADLPEVDAIAVISVYRPRMGTAQYLYSTLRSLFAALPEGAHVNVLVGDADTKYVDEEHLQAQIGSVRAARVHVMATPQEVAHFFDEQQLGVAKRATYNYARALRGYAGSTHLLLLEDDISVSLGSIEHLRPFLRAPHSDVMTLFNNFCFKDKKARRQDGSAITISKKDLAHNGGFPTTQAIVYKSGCTKEAGDFIAVRAGRESYDWMLGRFFMQTLTPVDYVYPSIVQHDGILSTGLSAENGAPYSGCAPASMPPLR